MIFRVRGVKRVRSKGHTYYYHRKTGTRITAPPGTAAFAAEVDRLDQEASAGRSVCPPGTWGWLVEQYRASPEFAALAPRTRQDYQHILDYLRAPEPGKDGLTLVSLQVMDPPGILRLRDKTARKHGRKRANYVVTIISLIWNWGRPRGLVPGPNPADGVPKIRRPRDARDVNRAWADNELSAVLAAAPPHLRKAVALGAYTGIREGDILRLPKSARQDGCIVYRHHKTGEDIWIPEHRDLTPILDTPLDVRPSRSAAAPAAIQLVTNSRGVPFTESGFRASFFKLIRDLTAQGAVQPGLTFHGLRHTVATRLADAGADTRTIMSMTGHRTEAQVAVYTRRADRRQRARSAVALLEQDGDKNGKP
jgi:integrase